MRANRSIRQSEPAEGIPHEEAGHTEGCYYLAHDARPPIRPAADGEQESPFRRRERHDVWPRAFGHQIAALVTVRRRGGVGAARRRRRDQGDVTIANVVCRSPNRLPLFGKHGLPIPCRPSLPTAGMMRILVTARCVPEIAVS